VIRKTHFTFADYNSAVLRLVTLPNLILSWNYIVTRRDVSSNLQTQEEGPANESEEEMLDITPDLLSAFQTDLARRGITISFVSGAWSPSFVDLVFSSPELVGFSTLILASETIYSPASLRAFSETLLALLRRPFAAGSRALVAAKKVYFGVGGGVDEFLGVLRMVSDGGVSVKVEERLDVKSEGVGRTILEIDIGE
jgi:protein-histidine N-methyltransferase